METELTKTMKKLTHQFRPLMPTQMRTIRYADEVCTPTGIVDSIRFEDMPLKENNSCSKLENNICCKYGPDIKNVGDYCKGCVYHKHAVTEIGICVTCYECKITVADFKSKNGHNFHGNRNYYVVPKEIVKDIAPLVPKGIGIITYHGHNYMRINKECEYREIDDKLKCELLYNAMKKWCDKKQT